jgi:hypothetical protein
MDPPELASEPAPCYARRGRIEPPVFHRKSGHHPAKEMHFAPSFFPTIAAFLLRCGLSFYSSLSSLCLCFPALQVGGLHVLFCPIDDQKVVKHLLLLLFHVQSVESVCAWVRSARVYTSCKNSHY